MLLGRPGQGLPEWPLFLYFIAPSADSPRAHFVTGVIVRRPSFGVLSEPIIPIIPIVQSGLR